MPPSLVPIQLTFEAGVQDALEYGSNDVWMVSRVFFWILREGAPPGDFWADLRSLAGSKFDRVKIPLPANYTGPMAYVDLRQPVGEDFDRAPIEVGSPVGSSSTLNKAEFDDQIVAYFRGLANESATMLRVEEGRVLTGGTRPSEHIRLSHNVWVKRRRVTLEKSS
jgi:hypothetical protein